MWESLSEAPSAQPSAQSGRGGRPWAGQVQPQAGGDPRSTLAPPAGHWAWSGGAARPGRHSIYGPARGTWARARPLLLWAAQGTRAGAQAANRPREGLSAQHPNMALEGERHS